MIYKICGYIIVLLTFIWVIFINSIFINDDKNKLLQHLRSQNTAYICITGQISRLELANKMQYMIQPLIENGFAVDIKFIMSNENIFTNKGKFVNGPFTEQTIHKYLKKHGVRHVYFTEPNKHHNITHTQYISQLDKKSLGKHFATKRSDNHLRQFEALDKCTMTFSKAPDIVIRTREDTVLSHFNISLIKLAPHTIYTQKCASWGGINDKMSIMDYDTSLQYFHRPMSVFISKQLPASVTNPETFRKYALQSAGLHSVTKNWFSVTTCRYHTSTDVCKPRGVHKCERSIAHQISSTRIKKRR